MRKRESAEFKTKVALEAIRGDLTLAELTAKRLGLARGGTLLVEETQDGVILRPVGQSNGHAEALEKQYTGGKADASADAFIPCLPPRAIRRMSETSLDASALLALLWDEPAADKVADAVGDGRMYSVNYVEVVSHFIHAGMPPELVDAMHSLLHMTIVKADRALAAIAGCFSAALAAASRSLGGRFCLHDSLQVLKAD